MFKNQGTQSWRVYGRDAHNGSDRENQTNPTIASYAGGRVAVFRITAKAESKEAGRKLIEPVEKELLRRFGDNGKPIEEELQI